VQVIVDNKQIYPLYNDQPVLIEVPDNHTKIVVSDGFHFTKPIELNYSQPSFYYFKVVSPVNHRSFIDQADKFYSNLSFAGNLLFQPEIFYTIKTG
jgi:hypothetical protein